MDPAERDEKGRTKAFFAVQKDSSGQRLLEYLEAGVDPNAIDARGDTALHWAVWNHRPVCARILVEHGADPNIRNHKGHTPLHHVINRNWDSEDILPLSFYLLEKGANAGLADQAGQTVYHHIVLYS